MYEHIMINQKQMTGEENEGYGMYDGAVKKVFKVWKHP